MTKNTLTIIKGDTASITVNLTQSDGTALNLTGSTVYFTVKSNIDDEDDDALISKDITSHVDDEGGQTLISLSPDETTIDAGNYVWDIQVKDAQNNIISTEPGIFTVIKDVTNRS